jgi:hypothetical protein
MTMMTDNKYNGWANRETWLVHLWLTNDKGTLADVTNLVRWAEDPREAVGALIDYVDQLCFGDECQASLANDLLRSALGSVDWREIVTAFLED